MEHLTDKCIHVCGINRCGQHAVSSWLLGALPSAVYKNNISFYLSKNSKQKPIFRINHQAKRIKWRYLLHKEGVGEGNGIKLLNYEYKDRRDAIIYGNEMSTPENFINGYNGYFPSEEKALINRLKETNSEYENLKGISPNTFFLFVIRSPWNHISSGWFWKSPKHRLNKPRNFSSLWTAYAEEFLGITNHIPNNFIPVIYDQWFADAEYRERICDKIGVPFTDNGLNRVSGFGGGSTFQKNKDGQSLKVLSRWEKCFKNEKATNHLINTLTFDDKLLGYSQKLFGDTPPRILEAIEARRGRAFKAT